MRLRADYVMRLIAGGAFGLYMTHLLYFLNPQISISPLKLAGIVLIHVLIAAILFGNLLWLVHLARMRLAGAGGSERMRGFGLVVLAASLSALIYWGHTVLLRVYLPREAVRNLFKASTIVAAAALVVFILWLIERTAPRKLSLTLVVTGCAMVLLSSFFLYQRRERYRGDVTAPRTVAGQAESPNRVILVTIRGLPFDWIVQLIGEDLVPFFSRERDRSFLARVEPFPTASPKTLWASLATGKLPHAHGVTGRFSYGTPLNRDDPYLLVPGWVGFKAWGLLPPVRRISAQLPAGDARPVWELMERSGSRTTVVNWPAVTRQNLDDAAAAEMARGEMSRPEIRFVAVSLNHLETIGVQGNRLPPRTSRRGEEIRRSIEQLDRLLSSLRDAAPDATLVVVSPSGPRPPALAATPLQLIRNWMAQEDPGSSDGLLLISGAEAVERDAPVAAAVTDVVPTVLFAAGLPVARDMNGRPLADAFSERFIQQNPISLISTYESIEE